MTKVGELMSVAKPTKCVFKTCSVSKSQTESIRLLNVKAKGANEHVQVFVFCFFFFVVLFFAFV